MRWMASALAVLVVAGANTARADILPQFLEVPPNYTPGTPFSFDVRVPNVSDFTSYAIELVFEAGVNNPDILAFAATNPAEYPYPTTTGFNSSYFADPDTPRVFLTLTDSTSPGVETFAGVNDLIATVTVMPGPGLMGPIVLFVGSNTTFAINMERTPEIIFPGPITIVQADAPPVTPVPTPAALVSMGIGFALVAAGGRLHRRKRLTRTMPLG